ncbi:sulfite oxidase-like oxidoreductase [Thalassospira sp. GO-4]|uniref:sulfite oxidase-like oxidoreductase n=1 Tax=Thalassospira sp. GO-4 TaxID=2946605 RepID=UPI002023DC8F|nr:sulfite oxidase-like oxidoreductase [Thalassospira sp. GO-4]URK18802.1 sulfite oxidase-like oxidoreductase [Thalassospira sp. GO-4]
MTQSFSGKIKDKLIEAKRKWAKDGRLLTGTSDAARENRLPPGQRLVKDWPVLDLGITPHVSADDFRLDITGLVENPLSLGFVDLLDLPNVRARNDIHCVTSWSRYDNDWQGVLALTLAEMVRPHPDVKHVLFTAHDGYTTNVRIDQFLDEDVLIAHHWNDEPLSEEHGGPVRVVIPKLYFWKSTKWVREIRFVKEDAPGFWEERGYHNNADPWTEERYG